jgi:hypothetical protein
MRWRIRAFVFRDDFVKYPNTLKGKGHTSPSALLRGGLPRVQHGASLLRRSKPSLTGKVRYWKNEILGNIL